MFYDLLEPTIDLVDADTGDSLTSAQIATTDPVDAAPCAALSAAQIARSTTRSVLAELGPDAVAGWERDGHLSHDLFRAMGDAGVFRRRWAEGPNEGLPQAIAMLDELAIVSGGASLAVSIHSEVFLTALHLSRRRDHDLVERALDGSVIGCLAATEPTGGSDLSRLRTVAWREGGEWRIRGEKRYITNAATATHGLVVARNRDAGVGRLTLFVVPLDEPGVTIVGGFDKLGTSAAEACHLTFDVSVPASAVVGPIGGGLPFVTRCLWFERIAVSAQLVATMRHGLRLTTAYMRRRHQFESRLIDKQALRHRLVDCWTAFETAQLMLDRTIERMLAGNGRARETVMCKLLCATTATRVHDECIQFLGGRGYTSNYPLERFWRDARLARIGGGTDEVMRELLGSMLDIGDPEMETLLDRLDADDIASIGLDQLQERKDT